MPFTRKLETLGTDIVLDSGDYPLLLDKALDGIGWSELQAQLKQRRHAGELVGAGLAMFVEKSGLGPFDGVRITVDTQGLVEVVTGAASVGQGVETVIAQICADTLGVDFDRISVIHGQTDRIEKGLGAFASRVTVMTGEATRLAATKLRQKALAAAAGLMQMPAEKLDIVDGEIVPIDRTAGPSMALGRSRRRAGAGRKLPDGRERGLAADGLFESAHMNYPYGVHIAVVRIDDDTGAVEVERYLVAYDVGKAVNPMLIEGQIVGGAAQGIGGALYEEFLYDDRGEPLSVTFADYLLPTAREVPHIEVIITEDAPSPLNPMGLKGAGEGGANAVGAAIAAAIDDALGQPGAVTRLPVLPQQIRVLLQRKAGIRTVKLARTRASVSVRTERDAFTRRAAEQGRNVARVLRQLLQQPRQRPLLFGSQRPQRLCGDFSRHPDRRFHDARALFRQRHRAAAAVVGVAAGRDKTAQAETIHHPLDGGGVEIDQPTEVVLRARTHLMQLGHHRKLGLGQFLDHRRHEDRGMPLHRDPHQESDLGVEQIVRWRRIGAAGNDFQLIAFQHRFGPDPIIQLWTIFGPDESDIRVKRSDKSVGCRYSRPAAPCCRSIGCGLFPAHRPDPRPVRRNERSARTKGWRHRPASVR